MQYHLAYKKQTNIKKHKEQITNSTLKMSNVNLFPIFILFLIQN